MVSCCIPRCPSDREFDSSITFHSFPSDPGISAKWIRNINTHIPSGGTWFPQVGHVVCSKHFRLGDFKPEMKFPTLKPDSVPTIFSCLTSAHRTFAFKNLKRKSPLPKSPLIVKVIKPSEDYDVNDDDDDIDDDDDDIEDDDDDDIDYMDDTPLSELLKREKCVPAKLPVTAGNAKTKVVSPLFSAAVQSSQRSNSTTNISNKAMVLDPQYKSRNVLSSSNNLIGHSTSNKSTNSNNVIKPTNTPKISDEPTSDLIEIGPSTFLKINPDILKVTKKVSPSGNTVMQFVMNPSLGIDASKVFQPVSRTSSIQSKNNSASLSKAKRENILMNNTSIMASNAYTNATPTKSVASAMLSTNLPVTHSFSSSIHQKYSLALRQKNRQICILKMKIEKLSKKVDELETKCVVQERQLEFTCLKKLRAIKKNADKGEPHANFIFEQIRGYFGTAPLRWSDSTMTQCSIWCRKAPYAYEYFKKADLFRLPCLGTVKRYMKKHPEVADQARNRTLGVHTYESDASSSDFEFDDEDEANGNVEINEDINEDYNEDVEATNVILLSEDGQKPEETNENIEAENNEVVPDSTENTQASDSNDLNTKPTSEEETVNTDATQTAESQEIVPADDSTNTAQQSPDEQGTSEVFENIYLSQDHDGQLTSLNVNGQEIILQSGNIIHLNSDLAAIHGVENQYFVIPSADEQHDGSDHQYSIGQPVSFVIQNGDDEQIIYITEDSSQIAEEEQLVETQTETETAA